MKAGTNLEKILESGRFALSSLLKQQDSARNIVE